MIGLLRKLDPVRSLLRSSKWKMMVAWTRVRVARTSHILIYFEGKTAEVDDELGCGIREDGKSQDKTRVWGVKCWDSGASFCQNGGGWEEKRGFCFEHVRSEMHLRHPSGGVE